MKRRTHLDASPQPLREPYRTPEGFLFCDAYPTRTGVFTYRYPDGTIVRELRAREDVAEAQSLASLGRKPLTNTHPKESVSPETVPHVLVGAVGDTITFDEASGYVRVQLALYANTAIQDAQSGKQELSCGYEADVNAEHGWWDPRTDAILPAAQEGALEFDARQRNIRYNHVALVDRGRAGKHARLRVDSLDVQLERTMKIKIQDREVEVAEEVGQLVNALATEKTALATEKTALATEKTALATKVDSLQGQVDALTKAAAKPAHDMTWYRKRSATEKVAVALGIQKVDDLDDRALSVAILQASEPTMKADDKSQDYLDAYVDILSRNLDAKVEELRKLRGDKGDDKCDDKRNPIDKAAEAYAAGIGWKATK